MVEQRKEARNKVHVMESSQYWVRHILSICRYSLTRLNQERLKHPNQTDISWLSHLQWNWGRIHFSCDSPSLIKCRMSQSSLMAVENNKPQRKEKCSCYTPQYQIKHRMPIASPALFDPSHRKEKFWCDALIYHVTNKEVHAKSQQAIGQQEDLLTIVKRCKLQ